MVEVSCAPESLGQPIESDDLVFKLKVMLTQQNIGSTPLPERGSALVSFAVAIRENMRFEMRDQPTKAEAKALIMISNAATQIASLGGRPPDMCFLTTFEQSDYQSLVDQ